MNKFILNVLVLFSLILFSFPAHSQSYEEAVGAHVITETLVGGGVDHQKIMANELERIMHRHTIEVLGVLSEHLPHVLKGLQTELKLKEDLRPLERQKKSMFFFHIQKIFPDILSKPKIMRFSKAISGF